MEKYQSIAFQDPPLPKVRDADRQGRERIYKMVGMMALL